LSFNVTQFERSRIADVVAQGDEDASTNAGVVADTNEVAEDAIRRQQHVGGEVLCSVF